MPHIAIVTGGSQGFGKAVAAALVGRGWTVFIDGRVGRTLQAAVHTTGAVAIPGDVNDPVHRTALVEEARRRGGLDLLVNNASSLGATPLPNLEGYPLDDLRGLLETNVIAPLALTQSALPLLRVHLGAVVNVTSDAAVEGYAGWGGYGASKAALEQWSRVLSVEEPSVAVWWTDPGDMRTGMHQAAFPGEDISDRPLPETVVPAFLELLDRRPPSGRVVLRDLVPAEGGDAP